MMGFYACIIEHDGSVYPCVNFEVNSFGNLLEQSFDEIWFGPRAESVRRELRQSGCPTCVSNCYTLPTGAGEAAKLIAHRVGRKIGLDNPSSPHDSGDAHQLSPGLLGHTNLES
jgi:radical SAM protein with 4Fe4S-binding SPASM domain